MGAKNVTSAFIRWSGPLSDQDRPFRVLLYMAQVTQDDDRENGQVARLWFGGWEPLAEVALGRRLPAEPLKVDASPEAVAARRARNAADVAVRTAIATLVKVGALTRVRHGGRGLRAEYRLNLDVFSKAQAHPAAEAQAHLAAEAQAHPAAEAQAHPAAEAQAHPAPQEQQRSNRGAPEEPTHLSGGGHLGDRAAGDKQMSPGVGPRAALAVLERAGGGGEPPRERPPWCGECYEPTRLRWSEPPDGGECLGRCPVCHPMAGRR